MIKTFKKIWLIMLLSAFIFVPATSLHAQDGELDVDLTILPELKENEIDDINKKINEIWLTGGNVMDKYRETAQSRENNPAKQLQSWIMDWNTLITYITFVIKFLSQAWIAVWALFIMYAWYKYMISVFQWGQVPKKTITNAIIWVIIVIFSYAIMKTLTSIVGLS